MKKVSFIEMKDGTKEDYLFLDKHEKNFASNTAHRLFFLLSNLSNPLEVYQLSRWEHALPSAPRAYNNNESEEMVVAALLHDIGDELAPMNHSEYAAAILKPYVSEKTYWIIEKHGEFQMYYYAHHLGGNKNKRDKYKNHKYYQDTINFCEKYDQNSFDPNYKSLSLEFFKPMVKKVFSRKPYSLL